MAQSLSRIHVFQCRRNWPRLSTSVITIFSYIKEPLLSSIFMVIDFENYWEYFETTLTSDAQSGLLIIKSWFSQMYCNFSGLPQLSPVLWQLVGLKTFCNATYFNLSSTTVCASDVTCVFSRLFWFTTNENKPMTSCIRISTELLY